MDRQLNDRITALIVFGFSKRVIAKVSGVSERQLMTHGSPDWTVSPRIRSKLREGVRRLERAAEGAKKDAAER